MAGLNWFPQEEPYCQNALSQPFDEAKKYPGIRSIEADNNNIRILLCETKARIDAIPDLRYYFDFIPGISGGVDRVKVGESILENLSCAISNRSQRRWSGWMETETVSLQPSKLCEANTK